MKKEIFAHKGGAGYYAESTLKAFEFSIDLGCDGAELDVHLSKDGEVIVYHDSKINFNFTKKEESWLVKNEEKFIEDLTLEDLTQYTIGEFNPSTNYKNKFPKVMEEKNQKILTLKELVEFIKNRTTSFKLLIEFKTDFFSLDTESWMLLVDNVLKIIDDTDFQDMTYYCSFDWRCLKYIKENGYENKLFFITPPFGWYDETFKNSYTLGLGKENKIKFNNAWMTKKMPWLCGLEPYSIEDFIKEIKKYDGVWYAYWGDIDDEILKITKKINLELGVWSSNLTDVDSCIYLEDLDVEYICIDYPKYKFLKYSNELKNQLKIADSSRKKQSYKESKKAYDLILKQFKEPFPLEFYWKYAIVERMLNNLRDSELLLDRGFSLYPNSLELFVEKAALKNKQEDWEEAYTLWNSAFKISKTFSLLNIKRFGKVCIKLNKFTKFEEILNKGLEKFLDNNELIIELAALENRRENWKEAVHLWERVYSKSSDFSALNYNRYLYALEMSKDNNTFSKNLIEAISKYPNDKDLQEKSKKPPRLAVQFYGHSRSFRDTFKTFKKNIIDENNKLGILVDIFIHTWDEKEHSTIKPQYKKDLKYAGTPLESNDISFIKENYKPKELLIEEQRVISNDNKQQIINNGYNPENYKIINNISYSIYSVNKLRNKYQEKNNIQYDFVILTRLDIEFFKPFSLNSIVNKTTKPFMAFDNFESLDKHIFYSYMETNDLLRNQNKYITGINLFSFGRPSVYDKLSIWHKGIFLKNPQGTENALTYILKDNDITPMPLYYPKPSCWNILRTNDIKIKDTLTEIDMLLNNWNFNGVELKYLKSLNNSNKYLFEYIVYLADTGQLNNIYDLIKKYGFEYIEFLVSDSTYLSTKKSNVSFMMRFYKNEYIPALDNLLKLDTIESNLIYFSNKGDLLPLYNYLCSNESIFKKDHGKSQMILNFSINKLIESNLLDESMALKIIDLYTEDCSVNKQRKRYMIKNLIDYFDNRGNNQFFKFLGFKGGYIQKIASAIHRHGDNQNGSKLLLRRFNQLVKDNSIQYNNKKKNPKVAVCISGVIRGDVDRVFALLSKNIISPLNADVFIHTWDERHAWMGIGGDINWVYRQFGVSILNQCPEELKLKPFMQQNFPQTFAKLYEIDRIPIDKDYLNNLINFKDSHIENEEDFFNSIEFPVEKLKTRGHFNQSKMLYGIYKVNELVKQFERKNSFEYDYIIRCRPDIGLNNSLTIESLNNLSEDEILVDFYPYGPQDQFRAGRRNSMLTLSNIWEEILKKQTLSPFKEYPTVDAHNLIYLWMIQNNIITSPTNVKRDVSLGARGAKIPNISEELAIDFKNIDEKYKNREDFIIFFNLLMDTQ